MFDELIRRPNCNHFRKSPEFFQLSFLLTSMESAIHGEVKTLAAGKSPFPGLNTPMKKAVRTSWTHKKTEFAITSERVQNLSHPLFSLVWNLKMLHQCPVTMSLASLEIHQMLELSSVSHTPVFTTKEKKKPLLKIAPQNTTLILNFCIMDTRESVQVCCNFRRNVNNTIFFQKICHRNETRRN